MNYEQTYRSLGNIDIYIIDQILKNRYLSGQSILDAGCGEGRNLKWFYHNDFEIYGIDFDPSRLELAQKKYPKITDHFILGHLDALAFTNNYFDHIICNAVLHFVKDETHFMAIFSELIRVLKWNGILFIRMASTIGLDGKTPYLKDHGSNRQSSYFLSREMLQKVLQNFNITLIEPVKTTNVEDQRAMTTLVFKKLE